MVVSREQPNLTTLLVITTILSCALFSWEPCSQCFKINICFPHCHGSLSIAPVNMQLTHGSCVLFISLVCGFADGVPLQPVAPSPLRNITAALASASNSNQVDTGHVWHNLEPFVRPSQMKMTFRHGQHVLTVPYFRVLVASERAQPKRLRGHY